MRIIFFHVGQILEGDGHRSDFLTFANALNNVKQNIPLLRAYFSSSAFLFLAPEKYSFDAIVCLNLPPQPH